MRAGEDRPQSPPHAFQLGLQHASIAELEQADAAVGGARHQGSDWALEPAQRDAVGRAALPRRPAQQAAEGIAESTV